MVMALNLIGQRFNRWVVISRAQSRGGKSYWLCCCDCGRIKEVQGVSLTQGQTKSCGCFQIDYPHLIHGGRKTQLYKHWGYMKVRCLNPKWHAFYRYGGRGIGICSEWLRDFEVFRNWALANGYRKGLTLDRIDNDGNYEPNNCRWISLRENIRLSRQWKGKYHLR